MKIVPYEVAFRDWSYLWSFCCASDMTGGYEDQNDLASLLKSPTKPTAAKCLSRQIQYWFQAGTEDGGKAQADGLLETDLEVRAIYERHVGFLDCDEDEDEDE